ncbi:putative Ig domain-containing protein, partial [Granulicella sp. S190]|uniref:putative Ig domain-containing protein n=1 Tax=Granulicella sp. S190 TaxID=1747226 RepID=UPI001576E48B
SLTIAAAIPTLTITSSSLASGTANKAYSATLAATGGTAPYTWSITSGSLPSGITLNASTGSLSGTPTATGSFALTFTVKDSSTTQQTANATLSLSITASALTITTGTLASGTDGTAYSAPMSATGGTPAYTWSITSGSLPAGLTLAATTGIISGTPTGTGTTSFTATVTDNSTPTPQTKSASVSITVSAAAPTGPGTTWYIRADGGTRYSAHATAGQCDGKADVAYPGTGTNQHCAFNDYRFLYDDQSYGNYSTWVISGGDTVILRGGPWRVGFNQGKSASDTWCVGSGDPYDCTNPVIPAGTATQPTRILGENYGSCTQSNMTQLYGGFGLYTTLDLDGAQFVTVQCVELTRHSDCIRLGSPAYPSTCSTSYPIDDFATNGIITNTSTHDVTLQDMWIHGFPSRGIIGPIGGTVNATRVDIAYNGGAGWDFDDGQETPNKNGIINLSSVTVEWSGCNQAYPGGGVASCYSQSTGGYGDGIGTPAGTCLTAHVDHSTFRYNTQDGYDMLHNDTGSCSMSITDSTSYGNNGAQFKWGPNDSPMVFTNNTVVANCLRLSAPFPGAPSNYNANLQDFCRAEDALAMGFRDGGSLTMENNTIVTYAPTTFDISCWGTYPDGQGTGTCNNASFTFENNVVRGYDNSATYSLGGQSGGPGLFYYGGGIGHITQNHNLYFGIGHNFACPTGYPNEQCSNPDFVNEPVFSGEASLDNFNFNITSGSPAVGSGLFLPSLTLDYSGATRPNPPSLGALEP